MAERDHLSIGEVLSALKEEFPDVTISKIRFLESQGLINPERTASGYRKFYDPDVERLRWILRQQRENFLPLKVIRGRLQDDIEPPEPTPALEDPAAEPPESVPIEPRPAPPVPLVQEEQEAPDPLVPTAPAAASMTGEELEATSGLPGHRLAELEKYGLLTPRVVGGTAYYDEEAVAVAKLAAGFLDFGVEARHLRMYKSAAEREVGLFEAVVLPMLKQRNPQARKQALVALSEMSRLGQALRAAMLRQALRDYMSGP